MNSILAAACAFFMMADVVSATTWVNGKRIDPISGDEVIVKEIASYGSYIYRRPSKFDLVFWPLTDEKWIWLNSKSGYAAFGSDFEGLKDAEKLKLKKWLAENYDAAKPPVSHEEKLAWLEQVYAQREMSEYFWCRFYRLMAYVHRKNKNEKKSLRYVNLALPLLKKAIIAKPKDIRNIEVLYLLGEYNRRIGKIENSRAYFEKAKAAKYKDKDGTKRVGHPYFSKMITDRKRLQDQDVSDMKDKADR
jgi:tetratricopeptide (TPR) repeat protein